MLGYSQEELQECNRVSHLKAIRRILRCLDTLEAESMALLGRIRYISAKEIAKTCRAARATVEKALICRAMGETVDSISWQLAQALKQWLLRSRKNREILSVASLLGTTPDQLKQKADQAKQKSHDDSVLFQNQLKKEKASRPARPEQSARMTGQQISAYLKRDQPGAAWQWCESRLKKIIAFKKSGGKKAVEHDRPVELVRGTNRLELPRHRTLTARQLDEQRYAVEAGLVRPQDCPVAEEAPPDTRPTFADLVGDNLPEWLKKKRKVNLSE